MIRRTVTLAKGEQFFRDGLYIYVNRVNESFELSQHSHDFWEISYVREGSGTHYIEDETRSVAKGDLFFIPVGTSHVFRPGSARTNQPLVVDNCIFQLEKLTELHSGLPFAAMIGRLMERLSAEGGNYLYFKETRGEYGRLFSLLHDEYVHRPDEFGTMLHTALMQLLVVMIRNGQDAVPDVDPAKARLEPVLRYLEEHYGESLPVAEAAEFCRLSERQFHRLFKRCMKMTYVEYVQNVRIDQSCRLLRDSMMTVSEIAGLVGYQDMKFFNLLFKKKTGMTPRQYRQRVSRS
jgi:AraC-like DNA-binding protein